MFKQMFFEDNIDDMKYCGHLYGLGASFVQNGGAASLDSGADGLAAINGES